ncbi:MULTISPECIES: ABC transporter substrate-binding protein [unclassified Streptomyces]|uniref:ABC transporter substrate-binding protein n=1 Tax=unclassified Streptomyces TaxID=2593676 RepID=UPI002442D9F3|nr:ABC transporter substrate-binding protein [Streptomyces sp. DH41]MDG9723259.1 ABC transporter substrate-binding protein [Streptomyces sp. DH41]
MPHRSPPPRPRRRTLTAVALAAALTASLTSCATAGVSAEAAHRTLVVDTAFNAKSIDPARVYQPTDYLVDHALYETLTTYRGKDLRKPVPGLATSWSNSQDGKSWTFDLREDARFSDGTAVEASDVAFSFDRLRHVDASPAYLMAGISVTAEGTRTVVLTTESPRADVPALLATPQFGVLNADAVRAHGGTDAKDAVTEDKAETWLNTESAGSGPYRLKSYSNSSQIVLEANPEYAGDAPAYPRVIIRNVPSAQQQLLGVQSGDSQIALDISALQTKGLHGDNLAIDNSRAAEVLYLAVSRAKNLPTASADVQRAIRLGIDYEGLVEIAGPGSSQATGIVPTVFTGGLGQEDATAYDPEAARALVDKAKKEEGLKEIELTLDYASDYHRLAGLDYGVLAQRVQSDLRKIGITVTLRPSPTSTSLQRYVDGKTQLALWSYPPDYLDPRSILGFAPGDFLSKRVHWPAKDAPELAALTKKAYGSVDEQDRLTAYTAWNRAMNEDGPFLPLLEPNFVTVASSEVTGLVRNPLYYLDLAALGRSEG